MIRVGWVWTSATIPIVVVVFQSINPLSFTGPSDKYISLQSHTKEPFREALDKDWEDQDWPDE